MGLLDDLPSPPKERYAVPNDNVVRLIQPGAFDDQLTEVLRNGARALLAQAVEAEVASLQSLVRKILCVIARNRRRLTSPAVTKIWR